MTPEEKAWCDSIPVAGSHPAKYNTFEIVERIVAEGIEGDFAEAGVGGGGQIAVMSRALERHGQRRTIHAFDSFEGIPKATAEDDADQRREYGVRAMREELATSGKLVATLKQFYANMVRWEAHIEDIKVHEGWLQDTTSRFYRDQLVFPGGVKQKFALLRIDVDLVESVRICMETLYPLVKSGGYVIFDDWGLDDAPGPWATQREFRRWYDGPVNHVEGNPGTIWLKKP